MTNSGGLVYNMMAAVNNTGLNTGEESFGTYKKEDAKLCIILTFM